MNNFIYFSIVAVSHWDQSLLSDDYQHNKWFNLRSAGQWPPHVNSRVAKLDTPWPLAPTVCPIPAFSSVVLTDFAQVIETIADQFISETKRSGRRPYLCWSGGIDSTAILVSLLKIADADFLRSITLLISKDICTENAYFFHHFVKGKIHCEDIDDFVIDRSNYDKIIIADGEGGNQIMGQGSAYNLVSLDRADLLDMEWRKVDDIRRLYLGSNAFHHQLIQQSIALSPVPIRTVYDYFWWTSFNFKFDDVLLRKMLDYTPLLDAQQTKDFYHRGLYRFYAHDLMQQWSLATLGERNQTCRLTPKYEQKKYIFDFDQNVFWFANKQQEGSSSESFFKLPGMKKSMFAIDDQWNKYSFANGPDRRALAQILDKDRKE